TKKMTQKTERSGSTEPPPSAAVGRRRGFPGRRTWSADTRQPPLSASAGKQKHQFIPFKRTSAQRGACTGAAQKIQKARKSPDFQLPDADQRASAFTHSADPPDRNTSRTERALRRVHRVGGHRDQKSTRRLR